jgi:large subunit ribosomal protein L17
MRHRKKFNHLGRKVGHRRALLANMASSLILQKRISTTTAKAKALRSYVEPLITKTKDLSTQDESSNAQRVVFSYLQNKFAVKELFKEIAPKIASRPGGYTRILKTGTRLGDNADMCIIELVDYNDNLLAAKEETGKSSRRRRRGGKKSGDTQNTASAAVKQEKVVKTTENKADGKSEVVDEAAVENEVVEDATEVQEVVEKEIPSEDTPDVQAEKDSGEVQPDDNSKTDEKKKD